MKPQSTALTTPGNRAKRPQILLTNDDGIHSPGLWAAAEALSALGYVHVVAPRDQYSGAGRSLPSTSDGAIQALTLQIGPQEWTVHAVGGSPAQAVLHGTLEILPELPDLVVSGINYGENLGVGITVSGTVGAALEAAAMGIPALAVSLETPIAEHLSYSGAVDFTAAAYFTAQFAQMLLTRNMPPDVHVLKVDVPTDATPETPWQVTRLSSSPYFIPLAPDRAKQELPGKLGYTMIDDPTQTEVNSDVYVVRVQHQVSLTPLSLDLTSRLDLPEFDQALRRAGQ